jgi:hypothetical protein
MSRYCYRLHIRRYFNPSLGSVCFNEEFKQINFGSPIATHAFETGIYSGTGVRNDSIITAISGTGLFNITYAFTDTNGCSASVTDTIRVDTIPAVTLSAFNSVCEDIDTVHLSGGLPLGGVFTASTSNRIDTTALGTYFLKTLVVLVLQFKYLELTHCLLLLSTYLLLMILCVMVELRLR